MSADYAPEQFPKRCQVCGDLHDEAGWRRLPLVGRQGADVLMPMELRNCGCGGTLSVRLPGFIDDEVEALRILKARQYQPPARLTDDLLAELGMLFLKEADAIEDCYAWPPRPPLSEAERLAADHLSSEAGRIYRRLKDPDLAPGDAVDRQIARSLDRIGEPEKAQHVRRWSEADRASMRGGKEA
jgi:hypothetical protein